jgi:hypothetical protein
MVGLHNMSHVVPEMPGNHVPQLMGDSETKKKEGKARFGDRDWHKC